jgi:hypothetical protein
MRHHEAENALSETPKGYVTVEDFQLAIDCLRSYQSAFQAVLEDVEKLHMPGETQIFSAKTGTEILKTKSLIKRLYERTGHILDERLRKKSFHS